MKFFLTRFPLDRDSTVQQMLEVFSAWIAEMKTSALDSGQARKEIQRLNTVNREISFGNQRENVVGLFAGADDAHRYLALRYSREDENKIIWSTDAVFSEDKLGDVWATVHSSYQVGLVGVTPNTTPKAPQLPRLIIQKLKGGMDGGIQIQDSPHAFSATQVDFVAEALRCQLKNRLPIVYCSARFDQTANLIAKQLAGKLYGSAHVFAEPDRHFSNRLRPAVRGYNAYGGAIGVYWPDGNRRRLFFLGEELVTEYQLELSIVEHIHEISREVRHPPDSYWVSVVERVRAEQLKEAKREAEKAIGAKSAEVEKVKNEKDSFITEFDLELRAVTAARDALLERNTRLESEIQRLTEWNKKLRADAAEDGHSVLLAAYEFDFYEGERKDIVLAALDLYRSQKCVNDSRRKHVVTDFLTRNCRRDSMSSSLEKLKGQFNGFRSLTPAMRATLQGMNFSIDESGAHTKITWFDDARYTFTLPKSGGDGGRGGKNAYSDLVRLFF